RTFAPEEDLVAGRDAVMVLSYEFWRREYRGDPAAIGSRVRINGTPFTIIGVAPQQFTGMEQFVRPAVFVPLMMAGRVGPDEDLLHRRDLRDLDTKARLRPGVTIEAANAEIAGIARALEESYPSTNKGFGAGVRTELEIRRERTGYGFIAVALFTLVGL